MGRVLKYVLKQKGMIFFGTISMLGVILIDLLIPYLQKILVDDGIRGGKEEIVLPIILGFFLISVGKSVLGYFKEFLYDLASSKVHKELKNEMFEHIQKFDFQFFNDNNTGELMSRIGEDVENIWQTISFGLRLFVENIIYFTLATVIIFSINWKLALICVVVLLPIGFIAVKLEQKFGETYGEISDQTAEINTAAQENIAGVRLVKAFGRENHEIKKFLKMNKKYYDLNMKQAKYMGIYFPPIEFLTNISLVAMIIIGGYFVLKGEMTLGDLVAFSGYIWSLIWPMRMLGWLLDVLSKNSASAKKIFAILDRKSTVSNKENAISKKTIEGNVAFQNVDFKYNENTVLNNINFNIKAGSTVAIMGTTGSGKSTIINLIGRYYDVEKGTVLIDGIDVRDLDLVTLRENMAIVPQDTFLFSDTIFNNITFGLKGATKEDVIESLKLACGYEFVSELEEGLETEIGERGMGLSGGQKQRIAIARALIKKAPILILDDATSALDMDTEHELLKNLNSLKRKSTTFIIAHRISAVKNADVIMYVEDGSIREIGKHEELLKAKGKYYDIYCQQFSDFEALEGGVVVNE